MKDIQFKWNKEKAASNQRKHNVTFDEATSVFYDDNAVEFYDDEHSEWEDRFLLLGLSEKYRLFVKRQLKIRLATIKITHAKEHLFSYNYLHV